MARSIDCSTGNGNQLCLRRIDAHPFQQFSGGCHGAKKIVARIGNGYAYCRATSKVVDHIGRAASLLQQSQVTRLDITIKPTCHTPRGSLLIGPNSMAKARDLMALARKPPCQVLADKTMRAGDEDIRHRHGRWAMKE